MSPRRFAGLPQAAAARARGSTARAISWRLNRAATVRLTFQRHARPGAGCGSGRSPARSRPAAGVVRFRGRFGRRLLAPRRYRLVVSALRRRRADARPAAQLPGGEGLSVEDRPRRFGRRRADFEALEVAGESLAALQAELVLLREENARLKAAPHQRAGHRGAARAARARSPARATTRQRRRRDDARARRGAGDPRVAAGDLPGDRARDGRRFEARLKALRADREPAMAAPALEARRRPPRAAAAAWRSRGAAARILLTHRGHVPVRASAA